MSFVKSRERFQSGDLVELCSDLLDSFYNLDDYKRYLSLSGLPPSAQRTGSSSHVKTSEVWASSEINTSDRQFLKPKNSAIQPESIQYASTSGMTCYSIDKNKTSSLPKISLNDNKLHNETDTNVISSSLALLCSKNTAVPVNTNLRASSASTQVKFSNPLEISEVIEQRERPLKIAGGQLLSDSVQDASKLAIKNYVNKEKGLSGSGPTELALHNTLGSCSVSNQPLHCEPLTPLVVKDCQPNLPKLITIPKIIKCELLSPGSTFSGPMKQSQQSTVESYSVSNQPFPCEPLTPLAVKDCKPNLSKPIIIPKIIKCETLSPGSSFSGPMEQSHPSTAESCSVSNQSLHCESLTPLAVKDCKPNLSKLIIIPKIIKCETFSPGSSFSEPMEQFQHSTAESCSVYNQPLHCEPLTPLVVKDCQPNMPKLITIPKIIKCELLSPGSTSSGPMEESQQSTAESCSVSNQSLHCEPLTPLAVKDCKPNLSKLIILPKIIKCETLSPGSSFSEPMEQFQHSTAESCSVSNQPLHCEPLTPLAVKDCKPNLSKPIIIPKIIKCETLSSGSSFSEPMEQSQHSTAESCSVSNQPLHRKPLTSLVVKDCQPNLSKSFQIAITPTIIKCETIKQDCDLIFKEDSQSSELDSLEKVDKKSVARGSENIMHIDRNNQVLRELSKSIQHLGFSENYLLTVSSAVCSDGIERPLHKCFENQKCLICGFVSASSQIRTHNKHLLVHLQNRDYFCKTCGASFKSRHCLKSHEITHNDLNKYECKTCGKKFKRSNTLNRHNKCHAEKSTVKCPICEKCLSSKNLKDHILIHTGEKPHSCPICQKVFGNRKKLRIHAHAHEPKQHSCTECSKSFHTSLALKNHSVVHSEDKKYKCEVCEKEFKFYTNLTQHKIIHSDERQYACETCGMKFKLPHHLRQHLVTHDPI